MQLKLAVITAAIATLAVATPAPRSAPVCSITSLVCCDMFTTASDPVAAYLIMNLGIPVTSPSEPVGIDCTPVISVASPGCSTNLLCCENNTNDPLISIGCVPA
ncbi:hypothetical protein BDP27DRAFT_1413531 [Rhodocollybia butyracea]|uniref:Hydrophobin n=1 Tax=Rhodocollybia butyracea TaxID=206335 RepID=A0A9P5QC20_9AGAR|nr:hypothetical protein BDP27DRAFT_1413531 [Rhodocollybia butyracea]